VCNDMHVSACEQCCLVLPPAPPQPTAHTHTHAQVHTYTGTTHRGLETPPCPLGAPDTEWGPARTRACGCSCKRGARSHACSANKCKPWAHWRAVCTWAVCYVCYVRPCPWPSGSALTASLGSSARVHPTCALGGRPRDGRQGRERRTPKTRASRWRWSAG
jgi:hypothetical protein